MGTFVLQPLEQRIVYFYDVLGDYSLDELNEDLSFDEERYSAQSDSMKDFLLDIKDMVIPTRGPWENKTLKETGKWILLEGDNSKGWEPIWKEAMKRKEDWKPLTEIIETL